MIIFMLRIFVVQCHPQNIFNIVSFLDYGNSSAVAYIKNPHICTYQFIKYLYMYLKFNWSQIIDNKPGEYSSNL